MIDQDKFKQKWNKKKWFILGVFTPMVYMVLKKLFKL